MTDAKLLILEASVAKTPSGTNTLPATQLKSRLPPAPEGPHSEKPRLAWTPDLLCDFTFPFLNLDSHSSVLIQQKARNPRTPRPPAPDLSKRGAPGLRFRAPSGPVRGVRRVCPRSPRAMAELGGGQGSVGLHQQ